MVDRMWEILTTLTDEAERAAVAKCTELGFDPNRGIVSLEESFANLGAARTILMDAIEKRKLIQLPITVQNALLGHLEAIGRALTGLAGGADEVVNLAAAIEQLNTAIWQYGLHNLSKEVLGYQTKMNQLKQEELAIKGLKVELEGGLAVRRSLEQLLSEAQTSAGGLKDQLGAAEEQTKKIAKHVTEAVEADQKASAVLATVQQTDTTSSQLLATTKASSAEVLALEARIKEFHTSVDEYRTKIATTFADADSGVEKNRTATDELIARLKDLENQIKVQIEKATGHSLFHSFQTRKDALVKSKRLWAITLGALVACSIGVSLLVLFTTHEMNSAFYLKLSMGLPLIYAITFCTVQYTRERKLEEEYAFKSNISISLIPYQELEGKLVDQKSPAELDKYTAFIIESVNKVFTSPTEKVFEAGGRQKDSLTDKGIKQLIQVLEPLLKVLQRH
jgi:hypothetical protein